MATPYHLTCHFLLDIHGIVISVTVDLRLVGEDAEIDAVLRTLGGEWKVRARSRRYGADCEGEVRRYASVERRPIGPVTATAVRADRAELPAGRRALPGDGR
ncbi:hypothetical protein BS329_38875 [Amycolatopsis coloradensis]|uniref:Uncharacterized protein n=1 Tax=Amycolatopsis coloradensis TaxID=76021 RepID=A0A1R0KEQ7_9PSEU|nr:hypothetical protein BS329_38875 [Amycolatopsis coloradensis]